ncbi:hypothetical protein CDAR_247711 [Caerostris darwini]|uniref:Uncharacterized protein n=1 Tax=Caerostris darwini TaxID=1538125 RepID=A0AAV4QIS2_9ARAC|nr:hypothetical protein CDAR_247711 [Caerostris darwini]
MENSARGAPISRLSGHYNNQNKRGLSTYENLLIFLFETHLLSLIWACCVCVSLPTPIASLRAHPANPSSGCVPALVTHVSMLTFTNTQINSDTCAIVIAITTAEEN